MNYVGQDLVNTQMICTVDTMNTSARVGYAPSVIVSKAEHRALTNSFRTYFPYGKTNYSSMESSGILSFFKYEYSNGGKPAWADYICSCYD